MDKTIKLTHPLPDGIYAFNYKTFQIYITFVYINKVNLNMNYFQATGRRIELERFVGKPDLFEYYNDTFMNTKDERSVEDVVETSDDTGTTMEVELNGIIISKVATKPIDVTPVSHFKQVQERSLKSKQSKRSSSYIHPSRTTRKTPKKKRNKK